ncbi:bactofilin family protein [Halanaerobacter jeridensis]|uniref:Cytoskeletal protein CcmA (Bactofilin family) n=1 Tax=Halanaerobacter jeridensis TaxID=706427 RepID=A0A939BRS1_9FIRM|nr:polymer-forming cytoskeletal protein [Halanaerobacter jeridensis]MBM7557619.1 cytoskeletal protein CcmA (bactofilin family) [Halanaerobacter jeridensis]
MLFGSNDKEKNETSTKEVGTIISQGTKIEGEVEVKESIRIDGQLNGKLTAKGDILVGKSGKLKADLEGDNIEIAGTVEGDVRAKGKLKLLKNGELIGDICYSNLVINDGAVFKGTSISDKDKETKGKSKKNKSKKDLKKN